MREREKVKEGKKLIDQNPFLKKQKRGKMNKIKEKKKKKKGETESKNQRGICRGISLFYHSNR